MKVLNVDELVDMLREYQDIPKSIERKQKILQIRLSNPSIDVEDAITAFVATENEITFLIKKWRLITKLISNFGDLEIKIIDCIMRNKNLFVVADELKENYQKISNKIAKIKKIFLSKVTFDCIYKFEEGVAYE